MATRSLTMVSAFVRLYRENPDPSTRVIRAVSMPIDARKFFTARIPDCHVPGVPADSAPMSFTRHSADRLSLTIFMKVTTESRRRETAAAGRTLPGMVSMTAALQRIPTLLRASANSVSVYLSGSKTVRVTETCWPGRSSPSTKMTFDGC